MEGQRSFRLAFHAILIFSKMLFLLAIIFAFLTCSSYASDIMVLGAGDNGLGSTSGGGGGGGGGSPSCTLTTQGTVYYIDPTGTNGTGTLASPYNTWPTFVTGNTYLLKSGTSIAPPTSLVANIILSSYTAGTGAVCPSTLATLSGGSGLVVQNVNNVTVVALNVTGSSSTAGVQTLGSTDYFTISYSNVYSNSIHGIVLNTGTGTHNVVSWNKVYSNGTGNTNCYGDGIETYEVSGDTIEDNQIYNNNCMGIELGGNGATVEFNYSYSNGAQWGGTSAIHTYPPASGYGNNNIIEYNVLYNEQDQGSGDGNCVELDSGGGYGTSGNTLSWNIMYECDGAGIAIYGSQTNTVSNNIVWSNQQGAAANHGDRADFYLSNGNGITASGNAGTNNIIYATASGSVDCDIYSGGSIVCSSQTLCGSTGTVSNTTCASDAGTWQSTWDAAVPSWLATIGNAALTSFPAGITGGSSFNAGTFIISGPLR
jgi:parallel beta-helix repeat protein